MNPVVTLSLYSIAIVPLLLYPGFVLIPNLTCRQPISLAAHKRENRGAFAWSLGDLGLFSSFWPCVVTLKQQTSTTLLDTINHVAGSLLAVCLSGVSLSSLSFLLLFLGYLSLLALSWFLSLLAVLFLLSFGCLSLLAALLLF